MADDDRIEIVLAEGEMADAMLRVAGLASSFDLDSGETERVLASLEPGRFMVPLDRGAPVGSGGHWSYEVTVPGGTRLATGGVTFISVLPTHRRRGFLRAMMRWLLEDARNRGEPLSALRASEATIYGRFGYGEAVFATDWQLDSTRAAWRFEPSAGSARLIGRDDARAVLPPIHDAACGRPGMFSRSPHLWDTYELHDESWMRDGYTQLRFVVWEEAAAATGYALFRSKLDDGGSVRVEELHALTPDAHRGLLAFMAGVDLTRKVLFRSLPVDEPMRWMLEDSQAVSAKEAEGVWFRLVDLPTALEARTYEADGRLVLAVEDEGAPWNEGRWRLEVDGGRATCKRTDEDADAAMDVADLASLYMGGQSAVPLTAAGRIRADRTSSVEIDRMFRTAIPPWSPEQF